ncbi:MAG TPA: hypothetical protein DD435_02825, partial [Cyanobacteria bacterium UBA8530]|nr:hypothetical protein [Cyanobacteria bacterium UBA8530]
MKYLPFLMSSMLVFGSAVLLGGCSQIGTTGGVVTPQASQASGVKLTVRMSFVARIVQAEIADLDHYLVELRVTKDNLADNRSLLVAVGASPATF